jgi:hypothetical protein
MGRSLQDGGPPAARSARSWVIRHYNDPGADRFHDGWFRTGDVASIDRRGYVRLVDPARTWSSGGNGYERRSRKCDLSHPRSPKRRSSRAHQVGRAALACGAEAGGADQLTRSDSASGCGKVALRSPTTSGDRPGPQDQRRQVRQEGAQRTIKDHVGRRRVTRLIATALFPVRRSTRGRGRSRLALARQCSAPPRWWTV